MEERVVDILLEITANQYSKEIVKISNYEQEMIIDSLQVVELVVKLENEFNIQIEDEDLSIDNFSSYDSIVSLVKRLVMER